MHVNNIELILYYIMTLNIHVIIHICICMYVSTIHILYIDFYKYIW